MVKVIIMDWLRKEANICNLNIMIDFIIENLRKDVKVTKHVDMEIRLVCEEALMNIINYAYPKGHGEMIAGYEYDKENNCLTLKVCELNLIRLRKIILILQAILWNEALEDLEYFC